MAGAEKLDSGLRADKNVSGGAGTKQASTSLSSGTLPAGQREFLSTAQFETIIAQLKKDLGLELIKDEKLQLPGYQSWYLTVLESPERSFPTAYLIGIPSQSQVPGVLIRRFDIVADFSQDADSKEGYTPTGVEFARMDQCCKSGSFAETYLRVRHFFSRRLDKEYSKGKLPPSQALSSLEDECRRFGQLPVVS